jgi:hypothetical protein
MELIGAKKILAYGVAILQTDRAERTDGRGTVQYSTCSGQRVPRPRDRPRICAISQLLPRRQGTVSVGMHALL